MLGARLSIRKLQNMKKTISIAETKHLSVSGLFSKAIENNSISDIEFNSILHEIEQYKSLKRQLINKAKSSSDVDVGVREQIREDYRKKFISCLYLYKNSIDIFMSLEFLGSPQMSSVIYVFV